MNCVPSNVIAQGWAKYETDGISYLSNSKQNGGLGWVDKLNGNVN